MCELTEHIADVPMTEPASAELARHRRGEQPVLFERQIALADEAAVAVVGGRPFGEARTQGMDDLSSSTRRASRTCSSMRLA